MTGLVLSIIGLNDAKTGKDHGFAITGIACSGVELVLKVI